MKENSEIKVFEGIDNLAKVRKTINQILKPYEKTFPKNKKSLILLKPNLNSDMIGLTGNTTDLRILTSVLNYLKKRKYKNIVIGDGTSSGFLNNKINIFERLGIKKIAEQYEAKTLDLNTAPYTKIKIGRKEVKIAKTCFEADLFINMPKIKTHAEAGFSCALKNMIGCVRGLDKQKIHENLPENIIRLNESIKPSLHIVDGLIGMEGYGPSRGIPKRLDTIITGKNPYMIDLVATKLAGINYKDIPYLGIAREKNYFSDTDHKTIKRKVTFKTPKVGLITKIANKILNSGMRKYVVKIRYHRLFNPLFGSKIISKMLFSTGLRQDIFISKNKKINSLVIDKEKCVKCGECAKHCPVGIDPTKNIDNRCVKCMYCYFICPENAIMFKGEQGYLEYQIKNYKEYTQDLTKK